MPVTRSKKGDANDDNTDSPSDATTETTTEATTSATGTTTTSASEVTKKPSRKPTSVKSMSKRRRAELEAKKQLAELNLKRIEAETALVQSRLDLLEGDSSSEDENEEDNIAATKKKVGAWLRNSQDGGDNDASKEAGRGHMAPPLQEKQRGDDEHPTARPPMMLDVATLAAALSQVNHREAPRYLQDLPPFRGHAHEWLAFKAAYRDTCTSFSSNDNVMRLKRSLKGTAREAVNCLMFSKPDPEIILAQLERRFGRSEALMLAEMDKIKGLTKLSENPREICIFASRVANIVGTIEALGRPEYLHNPEMVRVIIDKLPSTLKSKWYDYAIVKSEVPEMKMISMFLDNEADKCGPYAAPEQVSPGDNDRPRRKTERAYTTKAHNFSGEIKCILCKGEHRVSECPQFVNSDVEQRWELAKKNGVCFKCLGGKHRSFSCKSKPCGKKGCTMKHHKLLHKDKIERQEVQQFQETRESECITAAMETAVTAKASKRRAYLKIVPIVLCGPDTEINTYALLDEGSTVTLIEDSIAEVLGLEGPSETMWIQGLGGTETRHEQSRAVNLCIRGKYETETYEMQTRTVSKLNIMAQAVTRSEVEGCTHLRDMKECLMYEKATPRVLIGQDNWHLIVSRDIQAGQRDQPVASKTLLGWVLHGCKSSLTNTVLFCGHLSTVNNNNNLEGMMKDFFQLESLGIEPRTQKSDPEVRANKLLSERSRRLANGRYETGLLWQQDDVTLPNNYECALKRLTSLEKKLDRDDELKRQYTERVENLISSKYAEKVTSPPMKDRTWYLPHFPVKNPAKPQKPPRLVHDASAKYAGVCLNDKLLQGPDLLQSLPGVIMRFRQYDIAVSADIKEMFMQIKIRREDCDAQRFLWRGERRHGAPDEYMMTSLIFGATSSPSIALFIKNKNANDFISEYPDAVRAIERNHYMDDYLQSFQTLAEADSITKNVDYVHKQAGFVLTGWTTNKREAIENFTQHCESATTVNIGGSDTEKALGLMWNTREDYISFQLNTLKTPPALLEETRPPTKREAFSIVMSLFDPLGLIAPVTLPAKRIIQDTWSYNTGWDEAIPVELRARWSTWIKSLRALPCVKIPRCYDKREVVDRQLHTFVDASEEAYAAAVYWRSEHNDGSVQISLAAAKSRVTPRNKQTSIPRLELQAALLGARLARTVTIEHDFSTSRQVYWSDSRTVLSWIRAEPRTFKTFVAHRLAEIEDLTKKNQWKWVPTSDNVADDATRATPSQFDEAHRWYNGPHFLYLHETKWPTETQSAVQKSCEEKCLTTTEVSRCEYLPDIARFSSWKQLIRTSARVLQFIDMCKRNKQAVNATRKRTRATASLDPDWRKKVKKDMKIRKCASSYIPTRFVILPAEYLHKAEQLWVIASQRESFSEDLRRLNRQLAPSSDSALSTLKIKIDNGVIRLHGRINEAQDVNLECHSPAVLHGSHRYTQLYIDHVHRQLHHGGVEITVNELRQRVWVIKLRPSVRGVIKSCMFCRIRRAKPACPSTGDLPAARLAHHARPFTFTGWDYMGPLQVTVARHHEKRYVALFTCMTSRAIHLEVVASLSADSAIAALRRFIARRGTPTELWSDNATCFKAAEREMTEAIQETIEKEVNNRGITWRYIPPAAPFMGGAWERMVGAVKRALQVTLHEQYPSDETLATLLAEAENTVNSRPLTHVSVTSDEPEALTPNHILIGPNCHSPVPGHFDDEDLTARNHWRRAQRLADVFWNRWVKEYLPLLQHRREPYSSGAQAPEVGDMVIICDNNLPRNTWPRGRVVQTYPGKDGVVRVVDVATSGGNVLRRATKKIIVLPVK